MQGSLPKVQSGLPAAVRGEARGPMARRNEKENFFLGNQQIDR